MIAWGHTGLRRDRQEKNDSDSAELQIKPYEIKTLKVLLEGER